MSLKKLMVPMVRFCSIFLTDVKGVISSACFWSTCFLGFILFFISSTAYAKYHVQIDAPYAVRSLLKKYLDIVRFSKDKSIGQDQFSFLVTATPQQIRSILATEGYFLPEIVTDVTQQEDVQTIHIYVRPGQQAKVNQVIINFSGPIAQEAPERESVTRKAFSLHQGDVFTQSAWSDAKKSALSALQSYRYLGAKMKDQQAKVDPYKGLVDIKIDFDSGPTFTFGQVRVEGQNRYPKYIIDHVNNLSAGKIYNQNDINELQRRIQATPYYASVAVGVTDNTEKPEETPVNVRVSEYPYHGVGGSVGYATDTGAHIQGVYSYLNTFGKAWPLKINGRLDSIQQYGQVSLAMPPDQRGWINSAFASYTTTDVSGTRIYSTRTGLVRSRPGQFIDYDYSLLFYQDRLTQNVGNTVTSRALVPSWSWTRRNIDNPLFPRSGNLLHAEANFAVQGVLSDQTFLRGYARGQQYFSLGRNDILILRLELGAVLTDGDANGVPASLLFRAGGSNSIRGYSYQSIGNLVAGSVLPTKYLMTSTAEFQHWFTSNWGGAMFYDVGTAANDWQSKTFYQGVGAGIRWRSPVGPVNFDLAYGLKNKSIRPYLTLGITF